LAGEKKLANNKHQSTSELRSNIVQRISHPATEYKKPGQKMKEIHEDLLSKLMKSNNVASKSIKRGSNSHIYEEQKD
jgi:hypothetical protein